MSIDAMAYVKRIELGELESPAVRFLLMTIAENQYNDSRTCKLTQKQMAAETRLGERSVRRYLADLEAARIIIRVPQRDEAKRVEYDRIRIVGFTRWYNQIALPAKLAGGRKKGCPTGQTGRQNKTDLPAKNDAPTGQQVAATKKTDSFTDSNNPPNPPLPGGTGKSNDLIDALRADGVAASAVEHLFAPVLTARRVQGLGDDPVATLRAIRHDARTLGVDALKRAASDVLESAAVKVRADAIREAVRLARTAGARVVIERGSAQWHAWQRHYRETDPNRARVNDRLDRTQVPSEWPPGANQGAIAAAGDARSIGASDAHSASAPASREVPQ